MLVESIQLQGTIHHLTSDNIHCTPRSNTPLYLLYNICTPWDNTPFYLLYTLGQHTTLLIVHPGTTHHSACLTSIPLSLTSTFFSSGALQSTSNSSLSSHFVPVGQLATEVTRGLHLWPSEGMHLPRPPQSPAA